LGNIEKQDKNVIFGSCFNIICSCNDSNDNIFVKYIQKFNLDVLNSRVNLIISEIEKDFSSVENLNVIKEDYYVDEY
jgi:hypothetical protein